MGTFLFKSEELSNFYSSFLAVDFMMSISLQDCGSAMKGIKTLENQNKLLQCGVYFKALIIL